MENLFTFYDAIVLALYFAATLGLGAMAIRKASNIEGYTSAGGVLPGWLTGLSILGSFVSSISFLALPGKAFASNWNAFVWGLSLPFATYISFRFIVHWAMFPPTPIWKRVSGHGRESMPEFATY